jgi:type II secretory pathway pseudopilin PulG
MNPARPNFTQAPGARSGFSLVEVTIAIGIFAFVIVGIMGLFPVALQQRGDSAVETRAALVARQVFESIDSSSTFDKIFLPPRFLMGEEDPNLGNKPVGSFPVTLHFGRTGTASLRAVDGDTDWKDGTNQEGADALARVRIDAVGGAVPGLYRATVDFGWPASLSEDKRRRASFAKLVYLP